MTDHDLERKVRDGFREALDQELGPDPIWAESSAARRVAEMERRARRRWPLRALAVAALIGATGGAAALLGGGQSEVPAPEALASAQEASELPVLIRNERHEAVRIEITGRPSVRLDDCTEMVVELPVTGDWSISADGLVAYTNADLRASGFTDADRDNRYPVVMLQGGVKPVLVFHEGGIPEANVIEACRQGT